jgi:hypothetical protein
MGRKEALACRDRELSNMRSLLRSVTGKLEEAATMLSDIDAATCGEVGEPLGLINSVLEILS